MGGDKIVLLDGVGSASNGAANSLLSMVPSLLTNALGGNRMDPNLVAALMNGRNNQDMFGGSGSWWMWTFILFFLFGGRGFGNQFGEHPFANGLPAQLNGDAGRELLMQAIQGNRSAIEQISNALNCDFNQLNSAIFSMQRAIDSVAGQIGMSTQSVINAVQAEGCSIGNKIGECCCNLSNMIGQTTCATQGMIREQGYENRLETLNQTNTLQNNINSGFTNSNERATNQFNILSAKIDAQSTLINQQFCDLEKRNMQDKIDALREEKQTLQFAASQQLQTANIINQLRPCPVPAYPSCSPYQAYSWGQVFAGNGCCNNGCNNGCCCNNGANV